MYMYTLIYHRKFSRAEERAERAELAHKSYRASFYRILNISEISNIYIYIYMHARARTYV